ncbi:hypothetical protein [Hymenobacter profundi]|uniref:DUF4349 domain-containing protein n=1 Tax=Hymenobacter profundi TaxID=1982110 RepID=A0ABS6X2N8_9BACT|nr:hypothetical protein [Hymenobacter profundi]MBW3129254.1 hypothetical protein [Hymenobacter profundi]
MSFFSRFVGLLVVLLFLSQAACTAQRVQYMQLFYYGPQATTGSPIMRFSPAFKGKTAVYPTVQDEYMKQTDLMNNILSFGTITTTGTAEVTTEEGTYIDGKLQTEAQLKQRSEKATAEDRARLKKYMSMLDKHVDNITTELSKALNSAADDGWEVVQMASLEKSGVIYLLQRRK